MLTAIPEMISIFFYLNQCFSNAGWKILVVEIHNLRVVKFKNSDLNSACMMRP